MAAGAYCLATDMSNKATWFTWKSKIRAPVYTDCRVLARDPGATALITTAMGSAIRAIYPDVEYIVGIAEAGVVWSTLTSRELGRPQAFVRREPKQHGRSGLIECSPPSGVRAVVVDDVMASGGSVEKAISVLKAEKQITTIGVQTIANWNFREMRERFARIGVPVRSLVSFPELLEAAQDAHLITDAAGKELQRFYRNPHEHKWSLETLRKAA
ncbi:MAG TPA: phosphoribosyltransferase family protein [Solirubrobacteraceae bacterium]|nr:phosphoribosyltransferase family protein [Solirubrobacteraceae bacterium]